MNQVIVPPFLGEFGVMVMEHLRYVHTLEVAEKIVCCEKGDECLFPSATEFFTDYTNPVEDSNRCHRGPSRLKAEYLTSVQEIHDRIVHRYPDVPIIQPEYGSRQESCKNVKFRPIATPLLPIVDIVICPRYREFSPVKNWPHWTELVGRLKTEGFTIGVAGREDTCFPVEAIAHAWTHPSGATAGTVDLLTRCRLYIGTDTGVSHLAALMDTPELVFGYWDENNPDCTNLMQIANRRHCRILRKSWNHPEEIVDAVLAYLR